MISLAAAMAPSTSRAERPRLLGGVGQVAQHGADPRRLEPQQVEAHVLHGQDAGLEVGRHLVPPAPQFRHLVLLPLEQPDPPGPLLVVRLPHDRRDPLLDPAEAAGLEVRVHGVQRLAEVGGAREEGVRRLDHLGQELLLRGGQPFHQAEDGQPVAVELLDLAKPHAVVCGGRGAGGAGAACRRST